MNLIELHNNLEDIEGWRDFEPETIREIEIEGEVIGEDEVLFNKVMAIQTAMNAFKDEEGFFFNDFRIFEKVVLAFNGVIPEFTEIEHAEPHEIQVAIDFFERIEPVDFNEEVANYIAASYNQANIFYCPYIEKANDHIEGGKLQDKVKEIWGKLPKTDEVAAKIAETEESIFSNQIKNLFYIKKYSDALLGVD